MGIRGRGRKAAAAGTFDQAVTGADDAAGDGAAEPSSSRARRRPLRALWRHRRPIGVVLVAFGVFGAGLRVGWELSDRREATVQVNTVRVDRPITAVAGTDATVAIPNVIGLLPEDAQRVLTDAGVDLTDIEVVEVPAAGEAGLVVRQIPPPGVPVAGAVTLSVSVPGTMPDLTGKSTAEARRALDALGARTIVRAVYADGIPEGTVTATDPAAGAPLPVEVRVVVAGTPSSVFLADLDSTTGGCSAGDVTVNGSELPASLLCPVSSRPDEPRDLVYLVNRLVNRFEATLGQNDEGEPGGVVRVVVRADDRVVVDETLAYGESKEVRADIGGALRLTITATLVSVPDDVRTPSAVLGSARVVGGPTAIEELVGQE